MKPNENWIPPRINIIQTFSAYLKLHDALEKIQRETYAEYDGTREEAHVSCVNKCRHIARQALAEREI